ncbi:MAG: transposase [Chloroflexi bacterium]|nr:transposase [Chloroflexota bacterium]
MFKDKYRIESARLSGWDYSAAGFYFVTICTRGRVCCLGDVVETEAHLSPIGEIVAAEWMKAEEVRKNVQMDEWIIMPNHLHGIIVIKYAINKGDVDPRGETFQRNVSTSPSRLKPNTIGSMIGQIKSNATKKIRAAGYPDFDWQERFWDEIIWDERGLNNVRQYIRDNPAKWESDRDNAPGLWM